MRNGVSRKFLLFCGIVLLVYATVISNKYYVEQVQLSSSLITAMNCFVRQY